MNRPGEPPPPRGFLPPPSHLSPPPSGSDLLCDHHQREWILDLILEDIVLVLEARHVDDEYDSDESCEFGDDPYDMFIANPFEAAEAAAAAAALQRSPLVIMAHERPQEFAAMLEERGEFEARRREQRRQASREWMAAQTAGSDGSDDDTPRLLNVIDDGRTAPTRTFTPSSAGHQAQQLDGPSPPATLLTVMSDERVRLVLG